MFIRFIKQRHGISVNSILVKLFVNSNKINLCWMEKFVHFSFPWQRSVPNNKTLLSFFSRNSKRLNPRFLNTFNEQRKKTMYQIFSESHRLKKGSD